MGRTPDPEYRAQASRESRALAVFEPGTPPIPDWLADDAIAAATWNRTAKILHDAGSLATADLAPLAAFSAAVSRWTAASALLRSAPSLTVETARGEAPCAAWKLVRDAERDMLRAANDLGMSPRARQTQKTCVGAKPAIAADDPLAEFLNQ